VAEEWGPYAKIPGQPDLSTTWGFDLALLDLPALVNTEVGVHYCTAGCTMILWAISNEVTGASARATWPAAAQAAYNAWLAILDPGRHPLYTTGYVYRAEAKFYTGAGMNRDWEFMCSGLEGHQGGGYPPPPPTQTWVGPTEWILAGDFGLTNVIVKGRVGADSQETRSSIRNWTDRYAQYMLFADGETGITATIGTASVSEAYVFGEGTEEGSVIIGGEAGSLSTSIYYGSAPTLNHSYGEIQGLHVSEVAGVMVPLATCNAWYHSGVWTFASSDPGSSTWRYFGDGGAIKLHRIGGSSGAMTGQAECQIVGPVAWAQNPARFGIGAT